MVEEFNKIDKGTKKHKGADNSAISNKFLEELSQKNAVKTTTNASSDSSGSALPDLQTGKNEKGSRPENQQPTADSNLATASGEKTTAPANQQTSRTESENDKTAKEQKAKNERRVALADGNQLS